MTSVLTAASSQIASRQESANFSFSALTASNIASYFAASPNQGCSILSPASTGAIFAGIFGYNLAGTILLESSNATLTLSGQNSSAYSSTIPSSPDAPLSALPAPVISAGKWTWSASGGPNSDLPNQSFDFTLPPPVKISGGAPLSLKSEQDQTISWNGSGYDSGAVLRLTLTATGVGTPTLQCVAPAQAGGLTIPGSLLGQFRAGRVGTLSVQVTESGSFIPHAFLSTSASGDLMLVNWSSGDSRPVDFQ